MRIEPLQITAGDSVTWDRFVSDYPASDGWALTYYFTNSTNSFSVSSSASGDAHRIEVDAGTTAGWNAGRYYYQVKAKKGAQVVTIETGQSIDILPDFASGPLDGRSNSEVALDAIRATIQKKATKDQLSITVEGRTIQRMSFQELIIAERHLAAQVAREKRLLNGQQGNGLKKIHVRFSK